ncbi:hypothetical protein [Stenotrophomonas sp. TD3]|uniref:hypothetical protein n=1 Tax=Stenotrophomonas sp. TD3 TaxID=1641707 RepID=UPI0011150B6D|nr:hypothetical protein [Stenotrophomonas sp. TD3]
MVKSLKYPVIYLIEKGNKIVVRADQALPSIQRCPCYVIPAPLLVGPAGKGHATQSRRRPPQQGGTKPGAIVQPIPGRYRPAL